MPTYISHHGESSNNSTIWDSWIESSCRVSHLPTAQQKHLNLIVVRCGTMVHRAQYINIYHILTRSNPQTMINTIHENIHANTGTSIHILKNVGVCVCFSYDWSFGSYSSTLNPSLVYQALSYTWHVCNTHIRTRTHAISSFILVVGGFKIISLVRREQCHAAVKWLVSNVVFLCFWTVALIFA